MSFSTGTVGTWLIKKACEKGFENIVKDIDTDNLNKKFNHIVEKVGTKLQIKYPEILGGSIETFFKEEVIINELIKMLFINSRIDIETIKENFDNTTLPENFIKEFIYELKSALLKDIEFNHILSNNQIFISILEIDENINTLVDNSTNSTKQLRKILNLLEKNISNTINEEMSCCKNDTIEFKKLYKIHCFINIDNATIIFLYNGINLLLNSETQKLHHIENEFVVEGNEIEEICELAIKIYEYLLYFDWKKHGHVRPPHIQISITEKESIDIANNIYEYISLNLSEILYKQLSNDKQKLFASENNYYVFIKERLYGNVLRDYCFYQRDIILRRFSFLWLLADQLTRGSWGNSVAIWMDSVWKEIPDYHSNERMENEGGFETTILNIDILTNLLSIDELFKTRVWEKSRTYLEKRFDGSGFGPEEFGREGNYIKASIRHTALTTYLFGKIISSDECVTSAFNNFYIKGVKKLFLSETEYTIEYGNSIKIDDRSPVLQYFLYWHIVKFLKNKKVIDSIGKQIDINKILEQWDNSELKLQSHLLIDNYEGNSHFEHRYINDLVVPYGNFIKMEVYTFLTSAIFLDEEMPKIVRERYRNGIEYIINDYIKEFGDVDKRYTKDYLRPKIRGIKSHFSKKLQTKYSNNNSVDLGCTALLLRILRTEKILFALWPNDVPKWLPKICFYLNEDLCDNFDRYIISTEIYDVTNAGMLANCLIGDNKELINEILKTQKIYLYEPLGDDKGIISGNMLMKCVKALQQEDEFKAQVSNFSLLALLLEKRPSRFIDVTNFDEWPDYKQISNNESLKSYLTSVAYNDCIEEYTTAHISDERKNTILKIVRTMEDILGGLKNKSIFDVGCGLGDYAVSFYENGSDVTAIDISKKMIKSAKSKNNNIDFQILDMRNIPDNWNSKFDGIICVTAFQHIPIENAAIILKKFHDILKNNGVLRVDIQIGREQGFDPDLRYIETYTDENDAFKKLELKNLGFEKIISKEWKLKKGQNAFKRDIEFHFVELWLKKQQ